MVVFLLFVVMKSTKRIWSTTTLRRLTLLSWTFMLSRIPWRRVTTLRPVSRILILVVLPCFVLLPRTTLLLSFVLLLLNTLVWWKKCFLPLLSHRIDERKQRLHHSRTSSSLCCRSLRLVCCMLWMNEWMSEWMWFVEVWRCHQQLVCPTIISWNEDGCYLHSSLLACSWIKVWLQPSPKACRSLQAYE